MTFDEIEATLPWGLHDAYLERIALDWPASRLDLTVRLMMSEHQEQDQRACLTVRGLVYCAIDPPEMASEGDGIEVSRTGLWIDAGSGPADTRAESLLPRTPAGCFLHWLFVRDWNRFIHICGREVSLLWLEPSPVPARARTRALFAGEIIPDLES